MVHGVIFDLGSTLISHEYSNRWPALRPRMIASLVNDLQVQGLQFAVNEFSDLFSRIAADFDAQRQTHFREITSEYTLRTVLAQLSLNPDGLDFSRALAAYFAPSEALWMPMPHLHETLTALRACNLRLAIVSNAADNANVQRLIDNHRLRPYFDPVLVSAAVGIRKPNPRIFRRVLQTWAVPPAEIVMVGDTLGADILGAKNAGLTSIWVTMEANTPDNEAHRHTILPDAIASDLSELPDLISSLSRDPAGPG